MARLIETDALSNQDISSALAIGVYTADAARLVSVRVCADAVAGNGYYTVYATVQIGGSGSAYRIIPVSEATAASGVTAIGFVSIGIPLATADVLTVYLDGLAADTETPDTRVDFFEHDYVQPVTAGRTLAVDVNGRVDVGSVGGTAQTAGDLAAALTTIDGDVDSVLEDTGTTLAAALAAVPTEADIAAVILATPANLLATDADGRVGLAADGLDAVSTSAPSGVATTFREMVVQVWRRFFAMATMSASELVTYADDGSTPVTTQEIADDGTTQTQGAAE